jgi:hypothetical protein
MHYGGGVVDFGSKAWQGLKEGMGLVLIFEAMVGKGFLDIAASLEIVCKMYIGYGPSQQSPYSPYPQTPSELRA